MPPLYTSRPTGNLARDLAGHFWTLAPSLMHSLRPALAPEARAWSTTLAAATYDAPPDRSVRLSGQLRDRQDTDALVVIVHGLGGTYDAHYAVRAARELDAHGFSTLRLALRGADRSGEDFYHAGLVADLDAAFASPELLRYRKLFVLGYSLGGHVSLHAAIKRSDPRLRGVAAVCAPLDLDRSAAAIDRPGVFVYRQHVLSGLKDIYAAVAARHAVHTPLARVLQAKTIREWDTLTVVPRYGFADVNDYYARMSAGFQLRALACPTLLLPSRHDPMVPPSAFEDLLHDTKLSPQLEVCWLEHGGHVGFPARMVVEKNQPATTLEAHVAGWFSSQ